MEAAAGARTDEGLVYLASWVFLSLTRFEFCFDIVDYVVRRGGTHTRIEATMAPMCGDAFAEGKALALTREKKRLDQVFAGGSAAVAMMALCKTCG